MPEPRIRFLCVPRRTWGVRLCCRWSLLGMVDLSGPVWPPSYGEGESWPWTSPFGLACLARTVHVRGACFTLAPLALALCACAACCSWCSGSASESSSRRHLARAVHVRRACFTLAPLALASCLRCLLLVVQQPRLRNRHPVAISLVRCTRVTIGAAPCTLAQSDVEASRCGCFAHAMHSVQGAARCANHRDAPRCRCTQVVMHRGARCTSVHGDARRAKMRCLSQYLTSLVFLVLLQCCPRVKETFNRAGMHLGAGAHSVQ